MWSLGSDNFLAIFLTTTYYKCTRFLHKKWDKCSGNPWRRLRGGRGVTGGENDEGSGRGPLLSAGDKLRNQRSMVDQSFQVQVPFQ